MARFSINFESEALKRPINIEVVLPTDHMIMSDQPIPEANLPYRTLYMLEGVTGNATGPFNYTMLQGLAEDYNLAVICVGGENKWWSSQTSMRENYQLMVARDVVNFTRRAFRLSTKREDTYIGGFSMGGYGAFVIGLNNPDLFSRIIALDSGLNKRPFLDSVNELSWDLYFRSDYESMFNYKDISEYENSENDYEFLAKEVAKKGPAVMPSIFMACGQEDGLRPVGEEYCAMLKELGYDVTYVTFPGNHSWYSFNQGIEAGIKWLKTDDFRDNIMYYGPEAHFDGTNFAHWTTMYNWEAENR